MVLHLLDEASGQFGIPPERRLLVRFSQAVALNYRFASTHPDTIRGVIAVCGGLPGDWDNGAYQPIRASVLHIASREDEYNPVDKTEAYPEVLRRHAAEVEFQLIDGGHRVPGSASGFVMPWLRRILS
jgi:predicted esterase